MRKIIAEITKNWEKGEAVNKPLLCQQFEEVINLNYERGYDLKDWKFTSVVNKNVLTETIIAVFQIQPQYKK